MDKNLSRELSRKLTQSANELAGKHIEAAKKEGSLLKKILLILGASIISAGATFFLKSCEHIDKIERNADGSYSYQGSDFVITIDKGK